MKRVILDCDLGIDDALAIIFAIKSKKLQIDGITTVAGNTSIENTTLNVLKVLTLLDSDNIPVYKGAEKPLKGEFLSGEYVHGKYGLPENKLKSPTLLCQKENATNFITSHILANPEEITIITTGPLTNIANGISQNLEICSKIKELIIMGGAIFEPGKITKTAEFNIFSDPFAAQIVFNSGIKKIVLVPLDITHKAIFTPKMLKIFKNQDNKDYILFDFIYRIIKFYHKFYMGRNLFLGCPLLDPLAVGESLDPTFTKKEYLNIRISTSNDIFGIYNTNQTELNHESIRGQTITNYHKGEVGIKINPNMLVSLNVNANRFLDYFINTLIS